ncbi:MAG: hypothetical protein AAF849_22455, partial [Bacteroidota bacterium]
MYNKKYLFEKFYSIKFFKKELLDREKKSKFSILIFYLCPSVIFLKILLNKIFEKGIYYCTNSIKFCF